MDSQLEPQKNISEVKEEDNKNNSKNIKLYSIIVIVSLIAGVIGGIIGYKSISANDYISKEELKNLQSSIAETKDLANDALKTANVAESLASEIPRSLALINLTEPGGYNFMNNENGTFYLVLKDVTNYANGYKLILEIGNPSNATYSSFDITAKWPPFALNGEKQQTKTQRYTQDLKPGTWNQVEFILPTQDIKLVNFSMEIDQVALQ